MSTSNTDIQLRSERYSSKYLNKGKHNLLNAVFEEVKNLKNQYSKFLFDNLYEVFLNQSYQVLSTKYWKQVNNLYPSTYLKSWNCQSIFQSISQDYINRIKKYLSNLDLQVLIPDNKGLAKLSITRYQKNVSKNNKIIHYKGDIKEFKQPKHYTPLSKFIKYCVYCRIENNDIQIYNEDIRKQYEYYCQKFTKQRIVNLVSSIQQTLLGKIKEPNDYQSSSFPLVHKPSQTTIGGDFIYDPTNSLYKYWCKIDLKNKQNIYIPLQVNNKYHNFNKIRKQQWIIKPSIKGNKIDVIGTKEVKKSEFLKFNKVIGIDLNVKNNFASCSNEQVFDYDRTYINEFCKQLKKFDKIGLKNINSSQKKKLEKLVRKNEWYFKLLIHDVLDELVEQGITDIVMEDLDSFSASYTKNKEFDIKYSRLNRLLRLSNIKNWFNQQAEKRGIRVHLTSACYSSQQCSECGYISKDNRLTQEQFKCVNCQHESNADINASKNLELRFTNVLLKSKFHTLDEFGRMIPKKIKREVVKKILINSYSLENST